MFGLDEVMNVAKEQQQDNTKKRLEAVQVAYDSVVRDNCDLTYLIELLLNNDYYQYLIDIDFKLILFLLNENGHKYDF